MRRSRRRPSDDHFHAHPASLFERITRPDWCAAGLCHHGECVPLRAAACAGPSRSCDDYAPREPDYREMTQAYFDAKYAGEDGDWAGIAYRLSLHQG